MKLFNLYIILFAGLSLLQACEEDDPKIIPPAITPVTLTAFPTDETFIQINPAIKDTLRIFWQRSTASDGTQVMYAVQFDLPEGDFTKPVASITTDSIGLSKRARIPHTTLNI